MLAHLWRTSPMLFCFERGPINYAYAAEMSPKTCGIKTFVAKLRNDCLRGLRIS